MTWRDARDEGFDLARSGRRRAAFPLLARALAGARAEQSDPALSPWARTGALVTECGVLGVILHCCDGIEIELGLLERAVDVLDALAADTGVVAHGAHGSMLTLTEVLERRRARFDDETGRIAVLDAAAPALDRLVRLLVRLGATGAALVAAERARGRAFADRLAAQGAAAAALPVAPALTIDELRDAVTAFGATVLEFWADGDGVLAWVLAPDREPSLIEPPPDPDDLAGVIAAIGPPDGPVAVVPHRALHGVPFGALLADRPVVLLPSIGAVVAARLAEPPPPLPPRRLLVLADPVLPAGLPALPGLRVAATRLGRMFPEQRTLVGAAATLRALREALPGRDVLVLGTHAGEHVELAADPPHHDGHVRLDELAALPVDARLVVLMACGTAAGAVTEEGVLSAARALLLAGARSVLATLRPVGDRDAADVVRAMLHAYVEGHPPAEALRRARHALAVDGRAPAADAFVLVGAWR